MFYTRLVFFAQIQEPLQMNLGDGFSVWVMWYGSGLGWSMLGRNWGAASNLLVLFISVAFCLVEMKHC